MTTTIKIWLPEGINNITDAFVVLSVLVTEMKEYVTSMYVESDGQTFYVVFNKMSIAEEVGERLQKSVPQIPKVLLTHRF